MQQIYSLKQMFFLHDTYARVMATVALQNYLMEWKFDILLLEKSTSQITSGALIKHVVMKFT